MDNRDLEILQAIQQIIEPLKTDMQEMKTDMQDVKERLGSVENRLENVEHEVHKTNIIIENEIRTNIQKLVDGHIGLKDRLWHLPDEMEDVKDKVDFLEYVQKQMMEKVRDQ